MKPPGVLREGYFRLLLGGDGIEIFDFWVQKRCQNCVFTCRGGMLESIKMAPRDGCGAPDNVYNCWSDVRTHFVWYNERQTNEKHFFGVQLFGGCAAIAVILGLRSRFLRPHLWRSKSENFFKNPFQSVGISPQRVLKRFKACFEESNPDGTTHPLCAHETVEKTAKKEVFFRAGTGTARVINI